MIGKDGVFGAGQAFDHKISLNKALIQVSSIASVIDANIIRDIAERMMIFASITLLSSELSKCLVPYPLYRCADGH
jgi:K+-transporting ATPase c subunit